MSYNFDQMGIPKVEKWKRMTFFPAVCMARQEEWYNNISFHVNLKKSKESSMIKYISLYYIILDKFSMNWEISQ